MHILIIPSERYLPQDNHLHGIFQQHQAQALIRAGHQVGVISPFLYSLRSLRQGGRQVWAKGIQTESMEGVSIIRYFTWQIPRLRRLMLWQWIRVGRALFQEYVKRNGQPDIVHAHNALNAGILAADIKRKWGIPYLLTEHSSTYARGLVQQMQLESAARAFEQADKRLVVSPGLGYDLERVVGGIVKPWQYVPNILPAQFEKDFDEARVTQCSGVSFRFLNVGSLDENKNQIDLLRAFADRFKDKDYIQLRIAGDGPLRSALERLAFEFGIDRQVTFLGRIDHEQVFAEIRTCDVFALSSHYETFGVVLIEALACGKPVIATRCGGPEGIVHEKNGILVPVKSVDALGQAMFDIQSGACQFDYRQIRQDCIAKFGEQAVIKQLTNLYNDVLRVNH